MFSEAERQIYHCGVTNRAYDPLAVRRVLLVETRNKFGALCADAKSADPVKAALAEQSLTAAARKAFGLPPVNAKGEGVLDALVWDALIAFTVWLSGKGSAAQTKPDSAPCTDCPGK
jgi:hypothetical protein